MGKHSVNKKKQVKLIIDLCMTILLVLLMAYQVTGELYHEWIGAGMLVLFLFHNGLNIKWYGNLCKGEWSVFRVIYSLINTLVLAAIIVTGYSGIVLSRHLFAFLPIHGGMATARTLHLAASYWGFVLMSIHMGLHWNIVLAKWKIKRRSLRIIRMLATFAIAIYGAICFGRADIFGNMFLQNEFAILDYDTAGIIILWNNLCMMAAWAFVGFFLMKGISLMSRQKEKKLKSLLFHFVVMVVEDLDRA